ncbi:MAG: zinc metallopeptidase [Lachnospiraceae bacterium]|nr:zinc metallopeptidase [Lachnospiraceae bacterium]
MPYGYYGFYWEPTYVLVLIGAVISLLASAGVRSAFSKYSRVASRTRMTGAEAARRLLQSQGICDVTVEPVSGNLTDHYDPRTRTLRLSDTVYAESSVAAIGVAAHECGHAIQDASGYAPLRLRSAFVPVANLGSKACWILILVGVLIGGSRSSFLIQMGIWCFAAVVIFQIITLPVEFNASGRALRLLGDQGILYDEEVDMTKKVLSAAALTYVAGVAASLLQLLRLILLFGGRRGRD